MRSKVTYRQQYTRCGKERCRKCKEGVGHGPYWYAYWSENGRTISKYVGIRLPEDLAIERQTAVETEPARGKRPAPTVAASQSSAINKAPNPDPILGSGFGGMPLQLPTQTLRIYALGQFCVERLQGNLSLIHI